MSDKEMTVREVAAFAERNLCAVTIVKTGNDEWSAVAANPGGHVKTSAPDAQDAMTALVARFVEIDARIDAKIGAKIAEARKAGL